jgi:hypothetical protein
MPSLRGSSVDCLDSASLLEIGLTGPSAIFQIFEQLTGSLSRVSHAYPSKNGSKAHHERGTVFLPGNNF